MIKKLFAAKELEYLHRLNLAIQGAKQHLGRLPHALPIIHYIEQAVRGDVSVNLVTEIRAKLEDQVAAVEKEREEDIRACQNASLSVHAENAKLHAQLAEQTLQATLYKTRYEQANIKHLNIEQQYANLNETHRQMGINYSLLNEKHQALTSVATVWYSALYDSALLMGVSPTEIEITPSRIQEFLSNQNFVFRPRAKPVPDPDFKQRQMHVALADAFTKPNHIMPGIPCNTCIDCECTLDDGCFLSMKATDANTRNV